MHTPQQERGLVSKNFSIYQKVGVFLAFIPMKTGVFSFISYVMLHDSIKLVSCFLNKIHDWVSFVTRTLILLFLSIEIKLSPNSAKTVNPYFFKALLALFSLFLRSIFF